MSEEKFCNASSYCCDGSLEQDFTGLWNEETPSIPRCLQHTVLTWIPFGIFCLTLPLEIASILNGKRDLDDHSDVPFKIRKRTILLITRLAILVSFLTIWLASTIRALVIGSMNFGAPDAWSDLIGCPVVTVSLIIVTIIRYRRVMPPSGYTWITLCAFALFNLPGLISDILMVCQGTIIDSIDIALHVTQYALTLISLILFGISDPLAQQKSREWPEASLSFPNVLVFWWMLKLLIQGYRRALQISDIFKVSLEEKTSTVYQTLERNLHDQCKSHGGFPLFKVLIKTFYKPVLGAAILELISVILIFVNPLIVLRLMDFIRNQNEPTWHGYVYVFIIFAGTQLRSFCNQFRYYTMSKFGVRARAAIAATIYRKALTLSSEAKQKSNTGEIVNLMAVDATRFVDISPWLQLLWSAPLQVCIGLYFIYSVTGQAAWAGVCVMIIVFICAIIVSMKLQNFQMKQFREKDIRMKLVTEMMNGMKVVKLYAWEKAFENLMGQIRAKELKCLRNSAYFNGVNEVSYSCNMLLASLAIFGVYIVINPTDNVTPEVAFMVTAVFNIIYIPFHQLPLAVSYAMQTLASISRLRKYFCSNDLVHYIENRQNNGVTVEINHASFAWKTNADCALTDIDLRVRPGELVAVIGAVASGKSSLISAVCGEMIKKIGSVSVNGNLAYVAQQAWIQNMTVRNNILFGRPYNQRWYEQVIEACALEPDLAMFENRDLTVIGERGSNLSGGQKQRIALARAVYQNADIYLLDDPLSAVDVHVGQWIFDKVIGPNGLLKYKARIFVTHGINYLPSCDNVVLMENGRATAKAPYQTLAEQHSGIAEFLKQKSELAEQEDTDKHDPGAEMKRTDTASSLLSSESGRSHRSSHRSGNDRRQPLIAMDAHEQLSQPQDEEDISTTSSWKTYWLYARYGGKVLFIYFLFVIFSDFSYMGAYMWLEKWVDNPESINNGSAGISRIEGILVLAAFATVQLITAIIFALSNVRFLIRSSGKIHKGLLHSILRAPMSFFDTTPSGRLTNRFGKDMNTIDNQISTSAAAVLRFLVILVTFVIPLVYATTFYAAVLIVLLIIIILIQRFHVASLRILQRLEALTRSKIYSFFQESIHGMTTIRAHRQQPRFAVQLDELLDINDSALMTLLASNRWLGTALNFVGNLIVSGAALAAVLQRSRMLPGLVGLAVTYALDINEVLDWGFREASLLETEIVALERIDYYTQNCGREAEWTSDNPFSIPNEWPNEGNIEFRDYSTKYRDGLPLVLKNFKAQIRAGEKIGVVGRTGAGKSSLTLALFRLVEPVSGSIFIDGIDISQLGLHELRQKLTIIPQMPVLFCGTLRQNLDPFGEYENRDSDLLHALELSHLSGFVNSLPGGLDYVITEGGANLSVGQRQLLCLARALLRKTKILVLDEATASVDVETDTLIQNTVKEQFSDCTVITIAHRLHTILDCGRVMVMSDGRLLEYDSPCALMQNERSEFRRMVTEAGIAASQISK